MPHVYRIAHSTVKDSNRGFYVGPMHAHRLPAANDLDSFVRWDAWKMPIPNADGLPNHDAQHELCAFPSLDKASKWFGNDHDIDLLKKLDYLIRVFDVQPGGVRYGQEQVLFDYRYATEVKTLPVDVLVQQ